MRLARVRAAADAEVTNMRNAAVIRRHVVIIGPYDLRTCTYNVLMHRAGSLYSRRKLPRMRAHEPMQ